MPVYMEDTTMAKNKHLSLDERLQIQQALSKQESFKAISRILAKDCTTISKEIKSHILFRKSGAFGHAFNDCLHKGSCSLTNLCNSAKCQVLFCKNCSGCHLHCKDYEKRYCELLKKPPYVCNGCQKRSACTLEKHLYDARYAQQEYEAIRSECRTGITITELEVTRLDIFLTPLVRKGQSIHHICTHNQDEIMLSEKSIYNYIESGVLSVRNIDLPRKVRYRHRKSRHDSFKVDKACRIGRTYADFKIYMLEHSDTPIVEIDSVEGTKGGKVLLTIHFVESQFMLAYLRNSNTSQSVIDIFEKLYWELCPDSFIRLFPLCLGDNGSEFSNPTAIEFDREGNRRTILFYCDPLASYQKGAAENNHEFIRRIIPKGTSLDNLTQEKVDLMMNHINSYGRKKLGDLTPYEMFGTFHGIEILEKLGAELIPPNKITLHPDLLK